MPVTENRSDESSVSSYTLRPKDDYVTELYQRYGLGDNPEIDIVQQKALPLFELAESMLDGASLVLGNRVGGDSPPEILDLFLDPSLTPQQRFDDLLVVRRYIDIQQMDPVAAAEFVKKMRNFQKLTEI